MPRNDENKLGSFLREVSNWNWEEFCRAEHDPKYTSNEALIFALVRACAMEKLDAIKLALNRIDGKLKTPVKVEYPKIYITYPHARIEGHKTTMLDIVRGTPSGRHAVKNAVEDSMADQRALSGEVIPPAEPESAEEDDLQSLSLRQTLNKMSDHPREVPEFIIQYATQVQQWLNHQAEEPEEKPLVKSVLAAHLLHIAHGRDISALEEVFNQIDGKLAETIQLLGEDLYITSYATEAPPGAELNKDGVLQIEATAAQDLWAQKLGVTYGS